MAYGKDDSMREHIDGFRQNRQSMRPQRQGRRGPPYFVDQYHCSTGEPDIIRLVYGEYPQQQLTGEGDDVRVIEVTSPVLEFTEHFDGLMQKGAICSAGPWAFFKDKRQPCYGCDIYWETAARNNEGRWQSSRISRQTKYAFSVFDYGVYHKMDVFDRETGVVRVDPRTKQPYFNWNKCRGQDCDACKSGAETKVGNMSHWNISYTQKTVLDGVAIEVGKSCTGCGSTGTIQSLGWMCPNKACGEGIIDMSTTQLKREEIEELTRNRHRCATCGQAGFLVELIHCAMCSQHGRSPARARLFDVDLKVKAIEIAKVKSLQIFGWSQPYPVDPRFANDVKPVDLLARYAPDSLEFQAERFGLSTRAPQQHQQPQGMMQGGPSMPGMPGMQQRPGGPQWVTAPQLPTSVNYGNKS